MQRVSKLGRDMRQVQPQSQRTPSVHERLSVPRRRPPVLASHRQTPHGADAAVPLSLDGLGLPLQIKVVTL